MPGFRYGPPPATGIGQLSLPYQKPDGLSTLSAPERSAAVASAGAGGRLAWVAAWVAALLGPSLAGAALLEAAAALAGGDPAAVPAGPADLPVAQPAKARASA